MAATAPEEAHLVLARGELVAAEDVLLAKYRSAETMRSWIDRNPHQHLLAVISAEELGYDENNAFYAIVNLAKPEEPAEIEVLMLQNVPHEANNAFNYQAATLTPELLKRLIDQVSILTAPESRAAEAIGLFASTLPNKYAKTYTTPHEALAIENLTNAKSEQSEGLTSFGNALEAHMVEMFADFYGKADSSIPEQILAAVRSRAYSYTVVDSEDNLPIRKATTEKDEPAVELDAPVRAYTDAVGTTHIFLTAEEIAALDFNAIPDIRDEGSIGHSIGTWLAQNVGERLGLQPAWSSTLMNEVDYAYIESLATYQSDGIILEPKTFEKLWAMAQPGTLPEASAVKSATAAKQIPDASVTVPTVEEGISVPSPYTVEGMVAEFAAANQPIGAALSIIEAKARVDDQVVDQSDLSKLRQMWESAIADNRAIKDAAADTESDAYQAADSNIGLVSHTQAEIEGLVEYGQRLQAYEGVKGYNTEPIVAAQLRGKIVPVLFDSESAFGKQYQAVAEATRRQFDAEVLRRQGCAIVVVNADNNAAIDAILKANKIKTAIGISSVQGRSFSHDNVYTFGCELQEGQVTSLSLLVMRAKILWYLTEMKEVGQEVPEPIRVLAVQMLSPVFGNDGERAVREFLANKVIFIIPEVAVYYKEGELEQYYMQTILALRAA